MATGVAVVVGVGVVGFTVVGLLVVVVVRVVGVVTGNVVPIVVDTIVYVMFVEFPSGADVGRKVTCIIEYIQGKPQSVKGHHSS